MNYQPKTDRLVNGIYRWQLAGRDVLWSTAGWLRSVQVHWHLGCITIVREAHLLYVDRWDETRQLTNEIQNQWRLWTMPAAEDPSAAKWWKETLPPWRFRPTTMPGYASLRDMNLECSTGWHVRCRMSLGVNIMGNWGPRLRSWGNGSIECRNLRPEEQWSIVCALPLFSVFITFDTSLLHWILALYKWCQHMVLPPPDRS